MADAHPEYVGAYIPREGRAVVLTVMFNTPEFHERDGTTCIPAAHAVHV